MIYKKKKFLNNNNKAKIFVINNVYLKIVLTFSSMLPK